MKKIVLAVCTAIALATPVAFAQGTVDPAATAAVKELLETMKYRQMMAASFKQLQAQLPQMMEQMAAGAIQGNAKLSEADKKAALEKMHKEVPAAAEAFSATFSDPKLMDELVAETIPLYARHFTAPEIKQMAKFYKTPVGQKMMTTMPAIMGESMQISQRVMMPRMQAMIQKLAEQK